MRLAHFGTSDVESFGDLLVPLIARHRLSAIDAELTFVSPTRSRALWQDGVATVPLGGLSEGDAGALLLGGGDLVRADPPRVAAYGGRGVASLLTYTRLWLTPAELARGRGRPPLCWNAPGVPHPMTPRAAEVLRWAASAASYLSVRDERSQRNLRHAGVEGVAVVPDPLLDLAALWPEEELSEARDRLALPDRTLAVHLGAETREAPAALAERLDRIARRADARIVLLALAPCHGDDALARTVGREMRTDPAVLDRPRSLRQLAGVIAGAQAFAGAGLDGLIAAVAFGRPALAVASTGGAAGFLAQFGLEAWSAEGWSDAEPRIDELLAAGDEFEEVAAAGAPLLDEHWERILATVRGAEAGAPEPGETEVPSLDGILEEAIEASLAPAQRQAERLAELEAEHGGLHRELTTARRRTAERDAIVTRLSEALEHAREARDAAEEAARDADVKLEAAQRALADHEQAKVELEALRAGAAERDARAADAERLGAELASVRERLAAQEARLQVAAERAEAAEREVRDQRERAAARSGEAEALAAALREESERREAAEGLHQEALVRERGMRERMLRERDDLEERLEATLSALNEARQPAAAAADQSEIERERDRLRAELLTARAARTGLEEHVAALQAEIAAHASRPSTVEPPPPRAPDPPPAPVAQPGPPPPAPPVAQSAPATREESDVADEFAERYDALCRWAGLDHLDDHGRALPWPVFAPAPEGSWQPRASVIVCVHNALEDVRRCLASVARHMPPDAELVIVDDGSDDPTADFLADIATDGRRVRLITNEEPPHGYTIAANLGLRAASGEYLILLNSDTVVTAGWLDRVIACAEADPAIGIVGPVSNAASHQSVPKVREEGAWATNPLPGWLTVDGMAVAVAGASARELPRVPFVNGYCYAIKRGVVDAIGYLDEEHFAEGYCEENDFSIRAREAGFTGAVADDAFVFHAKSRSYTPEGRNLHAKRNYARFLQKHGAEKVQALVDQLEQESPVADLGRRLEAVLADPAAVVRTAHERLGRPVAPVFVLPGVAHGGSGGSHSVVQEASGLRALGVPAHIAIGEKGLPRARAAYPDHPDLFVPYRGYGDLNDIAATANVLIATHSDSVGLVENVVEAQRHALAAYYVQDYEPFFYPEGSQESRKAAASYSALPGGILFAKTDWVCNVVAATHQAVVHKVEASIDTALYRPPDTPPDPAAPVVVCAMVRLRTPRRQARATVQLLERLADRYGDRVEVVTFGCEPAELERITDSPVLRAAHRGLLSRTDVAELLRRADVFVDHSTYQAFGRTALEAMACGCVPAVPATGGAWEFAIPDVNALMCNTRDRDAVEQAVCAIVEDGERRRALADAGLATAARYSIERAALSEFAVFASALLAKDRRDASERLATRAG